jgi:hypothetical protein
MTEVARDRAADALEIARLAALDPLAYDREREAAAKKLGVWVSTLDQQVEAARPKPEGAEGRRAAALRRRGARGAGRTRARPDRRGPDRRG